MDDIFDLLRRYYEAFNERRFIDAARLFTDDAEVQHRPTDQPLRGPEGYLESARMATTSFPDCQLTVLGVVRRSETIVEVDLTAVGTHAGDWAAAELGTLKATGRQKTFRIRETLDIRDGKITYSMLNYDLQDLLGQPEARR
jgi:predicted ester cyclase